MKTRTFITAAALLLTGASAAYADACDKPQPWSLKLPIYNKSPIYPNHCQLLSGRDGKNFYGRTALYTSKGRVLSRWNGPFPAMVSANYCELILRPLGCWRG